MTNCHSECNGKYSVCKIRHFKKKCFEKIFKKIRASCLKRTIKKDSKHQIVPLTLHMLVDIKSPIKKN